MGRKFSENLMGVEMGKSKIKMTKPVYLGQAILDLSKMVMYKFHYDYMLPKYGGIVYSCAIWIQTALYTTSRRKDFYKDIAGDVEARFDTSGYSERRQEATTNMV